VKSLVIRTAGPDETRAVGIALGNSLSGRVTLSLEGPLGSGKTVLAGGVCEAVGVKGPVTSPTFTLQNEYEGADGRRVIHMDCFRLHGAEEFEDLGVDDRLDDDTLLLVEWGERAVSALGPDTIRIRLEPGEGDERRIVIDVPAGVDLEGLTAEAE
jgi:tRNA threonylcarbamoyladenosine biosynthesis protein TsaE